MSPLYLHPTVSHCPVIPTFPITPCKGPRMHALRAQQGGAATRAYSTIELVLNNGMPRPPEPPKNEFLRQGLRAYVLSFNTTPIVGGGKGGFPSPVMSFFLT